MQNERNYPSLVNIIAKFEGKVMEREFGAQRGHLGLLFQLLAYYLFMAEIYTDGMYSYRENIGKC